MNRPTLTSEEASNLVVGYGIQNQAYLLGIRGFFEPEGANKRGIYDDALFVVTPDGITCCNANTDPSIDRTGIAVLQPGIYKYKKGLHGIHHLNLNNADDAAIYHKLVDTGKDVAPIPGKLIPYYAFRQSGPVTVIRDGQTTSETKVNVPDWPWIDIHKGGYNTTSSEGCQTIFPDQWVEFRDAGFNAMAKYSQTSINYILTLKT